MRIDAHVHGMHAQRNQRGQLVKPVSTVWKGEVSAETYIQGSLAAGVERALVLDPPEVAFELKRIFGDYVMVAPQVDPDVMTPAMINEWFDQGAVGVKFIAPTRPYNHDDYLPLYDTIRSLGGIAVFHTGFVGMNLFEPGCFLERSRVVDINHMSPFMLDRIARTWPDLKILMAHFGNPWWEEARTMVKSHPNLYADFSGGSACKRGWALWDSILAPLGEPDMSIFNKLCFATDNQLFTPGEYGQSGRLHKFYDEVYERYQLPTETRNRIDRENFLSLLE